MPNSRVLVIDDDPMITQLLKEHLSNEGFDVKTVDMAEQGYQSAIQSPPDLILLDVMLPDATGYQMVGRFRQNPITEFIPIIMMTGTARHANQQQIAKNMGANEYVLKPFDVIAVGDKVRQLIKAKPQEKEEEPPAVEILRNAEPAVYVPEEPEPQEQPAPIPSPTRAVSFESVETVEPMGVPNVQPEPTMERPSPTRTDKWNLLTPGLFALHLVITLMGTKSDLISAATFVAGGWALLLGVMMTACAVFGITLDSKKAFRILGWAAIPIVLRAVAGLVGLSSDALQLPSPVFWLRPLDIFEGAAMVILGISFRKLPGSSLAKSLFAAFFVALAWCLTARGYFRPF